MLKFIILFLFIGTSTLVFSQGNKQDERRARIVEIIDEELREVIRLSQQVDNKDPELLLRAAELNLERARLVREEENAKFLALPPEVRRSADQEKAYAQSNANFETANKYALAVTQKFPRYKEIADVYYILAYNARELKRYDESEKLFVKANKAALVNSPTAYKSQLALADSLYNQNEYEKAIPLYEGALAKLKQRWWTKDAFNLAWCYYRVKNYGKAIDLMREIYKKSKDQKYIDMSYYVERDLGKFYVDAKRTKDGVAWYKSNGIDFSEHLIKISKSLIQQGKFTQAEQLVSEAILITQRKELRVDILFLQIELFDKFEKFGRHLKASKELTTLFTNKQLSEDQRKLLAYQIAKKASELQKSASAGIYKDVKRTRELRARQAEAYFSLLALLQPGKTAEPSFYKGETAYAARRYSEAMAAYQDAYQASIREGNKKIQSQAIEGMLASLGQAGLAPSEADRWYVPVYTAAIAFDAKSERSKVIRLKLYKIQMDRKNTIEAEKTLHDYATNFPNDFQAQESMLAGLMEEARRSKDYAKVKGFVGQINAGTYRVSKKYADALRVLMTKIQIEGAQAEMDRGDKSGALRSYIRVYNNPESTTAAKSNAAYNLAALYYEANDPTESYRWSLLALKEMDEKEVQKFITSFLTIGNHLFLRQKFQDSADLAMKIVAKLCGTGVSSKNAALKNAAFLWLAEKDIQKAEETLRLGEKCGIDVSTQNEIRVELAKEYGQAQRYDSLEKVIAPVLSSKTQAPLVIIHLDALKRSYVRSGDAPRALEITNNIMSIYRNAKASNIDIPVDALDVVAYGLMSKLDNKILQLNSIQLSFPELSFNQSVKRKLSILDSLTADVNEIQETGSGRGIIQAYRLMIGAYENFVTELQSFSPLGKSEDYIKSFKKAMANVWSPISTTAKKRKDEAVSLIIKNTILSEDNEELIYSKDKADIIPRYQPLGSAVLMDRGGIF